uniref:Uncharacterized protein n=1 Tax=Populus trichocarpa TaxID=3694 RepID=B9N4X0_POPTR
MAIPDCLGWEDCVRVTVKVFNGLISLVPCRKWTGEKRYSVQAMKQYAASESWTKLFNIEHLEGTRKTWGCEICGYQYTLWRAFVLLSEASGVLVENDSGNEEHVLQSKAQYVSKKQTSFSAGSDREWVEYEDKEI